MATCNADSGYRLDEDSGHGEPWDMSAHGENLYFVSEGGSGVSSIILSEPYGETGGFGVTGVGLTAGVHASRHGVAVHSLREDEAIAGGSPYVDFDRFDFDESVLISEPGIIVDLSRLFLQRTGLGMNKSNGRYYFVLNRATDGGIQPPANPTEGNFAVSGLTTITISIPPSTSGIVFVDVGGAPAETEWGRGILLDGDITPLFNNPTSANEETFMIGAFSYTTGPGGGTVEYLWEATMEGEVGYVAIGAPGGVTDSGAWFGFDEGDPEELEFGGWYVNYVLGGGQLPPVEGDNILYEYDAGDSSANVLVNLSTYSPRHITVTSDGTIWLVTESGAMRAYSAGGTLIDSFSLGSLVGGETDKTITGLTNCKNRVYVTNSETV